MEWLLNERVAIIPLSSNSVNDALVKGVVSKVDRIGFEVESDKNSKLPVSFTWESVKSFKFLKLSEKES